MSCPNCGTPASDQAVHCLTCGAKLVGAPAPSGWAPPDGATSPPAWGASPPPEAASNTAPPAGSHTMPPAWGASPDAAQPAWGAAPPPQPGWGAPQQPQSGQQPSGQQAWGQQQSGQQAWGQPQSGQPWGQPQSGQPQWGQPQSGQAQWENQGPATAGQLAGWWYRVGATVIDGIILFVVYGIVKAVGGAGLGTLLYIVVSAAYTCVLLVKQGQTVGMMALGIKCVREADGRFLSAGSSLGRWALAAGLNITLIGGLLDILWPLWDAKNQTLHDKAVGSLVVRTR
jgi:uncharacterized RDD family membrane protein YckC